MSTSLKLRLVGLVTTIAMFALPAADAFAGRAWNQVSLRSRTMRRLRNRVLVLLAGSLAIPAVAFSAGSWHILSAAPHGRATALACFHGTDCWVGAGRTMYASTDGGRSWHHQRIPPGLVPAGVSCPVSSDCWAIANTVRSGKVIATTDGGRSWHLQSLRGPIGDLKAISCTTGGVCVAVGSGPQSGYYSPLVFASTSDGGSRWSVKTVMVSGGGHEIVDAFMYGISCANASDCWAAGQRSNCPGGKCLGNLDTIEATTNGGRTWHLQHVPDTGDLFWDISCPNAHDCWAAGRTGEGTGARGVLVATTDGGARWTREQAPPGSRSMLGISCFTTTRCTATGWNGSTSLIAETSDGGRSWQPEALPAGASTLGSLTCSPHGYCLAAGLAGSGSTGAGILAAN